MAGGFEPGAKTSARKSVAPYLANQVMLKHDNQVTA